MKKMKLCLLGFAVMFCSMAAIIKAEDRFGGLSVSMDYELFTKYSWRGFELDSDPVAQTGLSIGYGMVSIGIWNSQDRTYGDGVNSAELDYTVDITKSFSGFTVSIGNTFYTFPALDAESKELYLGVSFDTVLSPNLVWYRDYGDEADGGGDGNYVSLGVSHSLSIVDHCSLDLSGNVAYNDGLFITGSGGDFGVSAGLSLSINDNLSLAPSVTYAVPFGDMADENDGNQEASLIGGFSVSCGF